MAELTSEHFSNTEGLEALPAVPIVSFDIKLGRKYSYVDFDYGKYVTELLSVGMSENQIDETRIQIHRGKSFSLIRGAGMVSGLYEPAERAIHVHTGRFGPTPNTILAHETQHRVDHAGGDAAFSNQSRIKALPGIVYSSLGLVSALEGSIVMASGYISDNYESFSHGGRLAIAGFLMLSARNFQYYFSAEEVRARKAGKNPTRVLRFIK